MERLPREMVDASPLVASMTKLDGSDVVKVVPAHGKGVGMDDL